MKKYVDESGLQYFAEEFYAKNKSVFATKSQVGSPLVAATAAAMTDTSKIYVYTGSETGYVAGDWYYYDGDSWEIGGVYNSVAVETDDTLSQEGEAADAKAVGDALSTLGDAIDDIEEITDAITTASASDAGKALKAKTVSDGKVTEWEFGEAVTIDDTLTQAGEAADAKVTGYEINIINGNLSGSSFVTTPYSVDWINALVNGTTGEVGDANSTRVTNETLIDISKATSIKVGKSGVRLTVFLFDSSSSLIHKTEYKNPSDPTSVIINNSGLYYKKMRILSFYSDQRDFPASSAGSILTIELTINPDIFTKNELYKQLLDNSVYESGYLSNDGTITSNSSYKTSGFIPVFKDVPVTISPSCRFCLQYDKYKSALTSTYRNSNDLNPYTFTPAQDGFIRLSNITAFFDYTQVEYNSYRTFLVPYGEYAAKDGFVLSEKQADIANSSNVLYKKKYIACGDSFTQGDFNGYVDPDGQSGQNSTYIFDKQMNMYKTYPYWIAKRNAMNIVNEAISGSTMTYIPSREESYPSFSNLRYQQIPEDAEYITLWFGINDAHQNVSIGDIDDSDNTTFYGAWNTVLTWLITYRPNAKIGIVITNGASSEYTEAERNIAKKYGLSYLDLEQDYTIPLTIRENERTDVSPAVAELRNRQWQVEYGVNGHPNVSCHKYQSTFIEHWMRGL